jgi:predicted RNA-binding Zn-ribbon protein involved in translation (DUF1610 family)
MRASRVHSQPVASETAVVRHCPYCGAPLGSFFGMRAEGDAYWCERCGEFFRVRNVNQDEGPEDGPAGAGSEGPVGSIQEPDR